MKHYDKKSFTKWAEEHIKRANVAESPKNTQPTMEKIEWEYGQLMNDGVLYYMGQGVFSGIYKSEKGLEGFKFTTSGVVNDAYVRLINKQIEEKGLNCQITKIITVR